MRIEGSRYTIDELIAIARRKGASFEIQHESEEWADKQWLEYRQFFPFLMHLWSTGKGTSPSNALGRLILFFEGTTGGVDNHLVPSMKWKTVEDFL